LVCFIGGAGSIAERVADMQTQKMEEVADRTLGSVARLLEFYDRQTLHAFFHLCDEFECDVYEVFPWLAERLTESLAERYDPPAFTELADRYARFKGWPAGRLEADQVS
jgi:hypothetical protein